MLKGWIIICAAILALLPGVDLFSEEPSPGKGKEESIFELEVGVLGTYPAVQGSEAEFSKYRDLKDRTPGVFGNVYLRCIDPKRGTFLRLDITDPGYDTQSYRIDGGKWGSYRYSLFYDEIPRNITYNAVTPYAGAGSDQLGYDGVPGTDPTAWNSFDYHTKRKRYGGKVRFQPVKPFYFEVTGSEERKSGTRPSGAEGAIGFGNVIELPAPVDFTTDHITMEAGYARQPYFLSLRYLFSRFVNSNGTLSFRNPFVPVQPNTDALNLSPDNTFHQAGFTGTVKLPFRSKFSANLAYGAARSEADLLSNIWDGGTLTPLQLSSNRFHGDVRTQNYNFALAANPVTFLSGKFYYRYYDRDNRSDIITTVENGVTTSNANRLYGYNKQTYGADLDIRVLRDLRFIAGYKHVDLNRSRDDIPRTRDDIYSAEARWSPLPEATFKIAYEKLIRAGHHQVTDVTAAPAEIWVRTFDAASKDTDTFKASAALSPLDILNFNVGCRYKRSSYPSTTLGLIRDDTKELNFDGEYSIGRHARVFGYFDYGITTSSQFQRGFTTDAEPYGTVQNATNFNWQSDQEDITFDLGLVVDLYIVPQKLTLRLSGDYLKTHGTNDFTYFSGNALTAGRTNENIDIRNWDSYRTEFYMIKFLYHHTASTLFTFGYAYERYSLSDAQYEGYVNTLGSPVNSYLSGAYANPGYKADIFFLGVSHRF